jgi:response regulator RpfG family c-di-GMP phosphodiesterase
MKFKETILVIDDDKSIRFSLKCFLQDRYDVYLAASALEGMFCCSEHRIDVIMMDIRMPGKDGLSALIDLKKKYPLLEVVLMTAYASLETVRKAIRFGAFDYLVKPFSQEEVSAVIERAFEKRINNLTMKKERDQLFENQLCLEDQVIEAKQKMINNCESTIISALLNINARDNYTYDHAKRVTSLCARIAGEMDLSSDETEWIRCAAMMHDIGKLGVEESVLREKGQYTPDQLEEMKRHPQFGADFLLALPFLKEAFELVLHHHERFDGKGYPQGLAGENIPLGARIITVADAIDAMAHSRYRKGYSPEQITSELENCSDRQFDPGIIDIVLEKELLSDLLPGD